MVKPRSSAYVVTTCDPCYGHGGVAAHIVTRRATVLASRWAKKRRACAKLSADVPTRALLLQIYHGVAGLDGISRARWTHLVLKWR